MKIKNINKNPLEYVFENNLVNDGLWCEFGVFNGRTINYFSKFTKNKVHGFDTFTGLPDKWKLNDIIEMESGHYSYRDFAKEWGLNEILPNVNENVILYEGFFKDTIPKFMNVRKEPITFIHIDCDLYSSTKDVLYGTIEQISNDCIIVFDELINYPNYRNHEYKALCEWVDDNNILFEYIGMNGVFTENPEIIYDKENQNVAIKIINNPKYQNK